MAADPSRECPFLGEAIDVPWAWRMGPKRSTLVNLLNRATISAVLLSRSCSRRSKCVIASHPSMHKNAPQAHRKRITSEKPAEPWSRQQARNNGALKRWARPGWRTRMRTIRRQHDLARRQRAKSPFHREAAQRRHGAIFALICLAFCVHREPQTALRGGQQAGRSSPAA